MANFCKLIQAKPVVLLFPHLLSEGCTPRHLQSSQYQLIPLSFLLGSPNHSPHYWRSRAHRCQGGADPQGARERGVTVAQAGRQVPPGWGNQFRVRPKKAPRVSNWPRLHQDRDWVHGQAPDLQDGHEGRHGQWRGRLWLPQSGWESQ